MDLCGKPRSSAGNDLHGLGYGPNYIPRRAMSCPTPASMLFRSLVLVAACCLSAFAACTCKIDVGPGWTPYLSQALSDAEWDCG
jgi:hypothetical protein